jgi:hypothetical protein
MSTSPSAEGTSAVLVSVAGVCAVSVVVVVVLVVGVVAVSVVVPVDVAGVELALSSGRRLGGFGSLRGLLLLVAACDERHGERRNGDAGEEALHQAHFGKGHGLSCGKGYGILGSIDAMTAASRNCSRHSRYTCFGAGTSGVEASNFKEL